MGENFVARATVAIDASTDEVWNALVSPEAIAHYMFGAKVDTDWREGSAIRWTGEWNGKPFEDKGVILEIVPGRRLRYSHFSPRSGLADEPENYHTVTIEVLSQGKQTLVGLSQDNNPTAEAREHSQENWKRMLAGLKEYVER